MAAALVSRNMVVVALLAEWITAFSVHPAAMVAAAAHRVRTNLHEEEGGRSMRKIGLVVALLAAVLCAGFVSAKFQKPDQQFIPHTIVYRFTQYDETEKPISIETVVRRVYADGAWKHTTMRTDGSVVHTSGKLAGNITSRKTDANSPQLLGFAYYEDLERNPAWISSDLQDFLMFTALRDNGT
jgi:hypothetical protein